MKWFLMLLIFVGGVYYLVRQHNNDKIRQQQIAAEKIKTSQDAAEPPLPDKPADIPVIKFSPQTLRTLRLLTQDTDAKVRFASLELLWQLRDEQAPALVKQMLTNETDTNVKRNIIEMLGKDKNKLNLELLSVALEDYDKETRQKTIETIGMFSTREVLPFLNKALHDYDEEVRLKALQAINRIRSEVEANKELRLKTLEQRQPVFKLD